MLPKLVFVAVILLCGSTCYIQAFEIPQVSSQRASQAFQCPHLIGDIAGSGSFVASLDGNGPNVRTFKLSPKSDFYDNFSSETVDSGGYVIDTNSQWYSYLHPSGYSLLWQVSSHGFVYNEQRIQNPGGIFAKLLESSYIVVTANTLDTYRYNSSYLWTLDNSFKFQNNTLDPTLPLFGISQIGDAFAILDSTNMNIQIYSRFGWSWRYVDAVPLVATLGIPRAVVPIGYGNNQVIVSYANPSQNSSIPSGAVVVHVKTIGSWQPIVIKASDLGIKPPGEFGSALLAIDPKRILVSAPKSGYNENTQTGGQVFILSQFLNGSWGVVKELVTRDQPKILYGTGLALTTTDVIIAAGQSSFAGNNCYLYSVPLYKII